MTRPRPFDWQDGERRIHFGRGRLPEAVERLGGSGFTLLTTPRAAAAAPQVAEAAAIVHHVPPGPVDRIAAGLLEIVAPADRIVALGGGRVIDATKAVVAVLRARDRVARAMAVPTTLSGAEMTRGHRHAAGVPAGTPRVRPAVVVADPSLMASQPTPDLAASALNALGHAVEGPCTPKANPVATMAAREGARLLAGAFAGDGEPDRDAAALGALLAGYAIDSAGYGLHHVLAQTIVRTAEIPHALANGVLLPHTIVALGWRFPEQHAELTRALGEDPADVASRLRAVTPATSLGALGVDRPTLARAADAAAQREDLAMTPPPADRAEILALYEQAL